MNVKEKFDQPIEDLISEIELNVEQNRLVIQVRTERELASSLDSLRDSMNRNSASSENLAKRLNILTLAIFIATIIGVGVAFLSLGVAFLNIVSK